VVGLATDSPGWLEAQYNRAVCYHAMNDDQRAREVIRVVKGMVKKIPPDVQKQFDELEATLKQG
jgi:hypothetical protein